MARSNGESAGQLLKQFSQDTATLIRKEMELAKAELTEKGKKASKGAGMFGGAGLFGLGAFAALTACLILVLAEAMDAWVAALIVAAVYGAVAGVLALQGKQKVEEAAPPQPEQTIETVKEDVQWAKRQAASAGR
ncbi:MAG TPA: phage holin family protein [Solirubrobacterales bacterium]